MCFNNQGTLLKELNIKNYALIDHLKINFEDGFSVITGETGSGKSIILGALSLILGERADLKSIRNADEKCVIEGIFSIDERDVEPLFSENDLDFEKETIIRREINSQGKSRAFINDTPVSLQILKSLSEKLIDIHSQHETMLLNDKKFVFGIIDSQIQNKKLFDEYHSKFKIYKTTLEKLKTLIEKEVQAQNDKDFYTFLLQEFEEINIDAAIENDIASEYNLLSNAEQIKSVLNSSVNFLSNNQGGIISDLISAISNLESIQNIDPSILEIKNRLKSTLIEIEDIERDLSVMESRVEIDDKRLMLIEEDISLLNRLLKKHQLTSFEELLEKKKSISVQLENIGCISEQITTLEKNKQTLLKELQNLAKEISNERKKVIPTLENEAIELLSSMKMKNAAIQFKISPSEEIHSLGNDEILLLAKTNLGGNFELLKKIASGGESSRIMLAIKSLQTQSKSLPTIIFDEIDTGVSGEVATNMGAIMQKLGQKMQVLSITHLPQIASKGTHHFKVYKEEANATTLTKIRNLDAQERVEEIASMLSSNKITDAAIKNANELLAEK